MNIEITPATVSDARQVLSYYTDILSENLPFIMSNPVPTLEQEINFIKKHDGNYSLLLLAKHEGLLIGMNGYQIERHPQHSHSCSLGITVAKSFRGKGVGTQLIQSGIGWCKSKFVLRLELEVIDGNPAVPFYEKLGFKVEGRKRKFVRIGESFKDMIIMAQILA